MRGRAVKTPDGWMVGCSYRPTPAAEGGTPAAASPPSAASTRRCPCRDGDPSSPRAARRRRSSAAPGTARRRRGSGAIRHRRPAAAAPAGDARFPSLRRATSSTKVTRFYRDKVCCSLLTRTLSIFHFTRVITDTVIVRLPRMRAVVSEVVIPDGEMGAVSGQMPPGQLPTVRCPYLLNNPVKSLPRSEAPSAGS